MALRLDEATYKNCLPFIPPIQYGKVVKVYDGDTIHIAAPLFESIYRFKIRLRKIDAPEKNSKDMYTKQAAEIATNLLVDKVMDKIIWLENVAYDKYGRILANIKVDDEDVSDWLLNSGWVKNYGQQLPDDHWKNLILSTKTKTNYLIQNFIDCQIQSSAELPSKLSTLKQ
jgi:endonuclease YncB( thermonuclease family)